MELHDAFQNTTSASIYAHRVAGGDCHHRGFDWPAGTSGAKGA
jgi:hypothetical protein